MRPIIITEFGTGKSTIHVIVENRNISCSQYVDVMPLSIIVRTNGFCSEYPFSGSLSKQLSIT